METIMHQQDLSFRARCWGLKIERFSPSLPQPSRNMQALLDSQLS